MQVCSHRASPENLAVRTQACRATEWTLLSQHRKTQSPPPPASQFLQHILVPQRPTFPSAFLFKFTGTGCKLTVERSRWANLAEQSFFSSSARRVKAGPWAPHQCRKGFGPAKFSTGKKKKEPLHSQRLASISGMWSSKFQILLCVHLRIFGKDWCQVSRTGGLTRVTKMAPGFSELLPSLAEMAPRTETREAETQEYL